MNHLRWVSTPNFMIGIPRTHTPGSSPAESKLTLSSEMNIYQAVPDTPASVLMETPEQRTERFRREREIAREQIQSENYHIYRHHDGTVFDITLARGDKRTTGREKHHLRLYESNLFPHNYITATTYTHISPGAAPTAVPKPHHIVVARSPHFADALHAWRLLILTRTGTEWLRWADPRLADQPRLAHGGSQAQHQQQQQQVAAAVAAAQQEVREAVAAMPVPPLRARTLTLWVLGEQGSEELGDGKGERFVIQRAKGRRR